VEPGGKTQAVFQTRKKKKKKKKKNKSQSWTPKPGPQNNPPFTHPKKTEIAHEEKR